ncbi:hypothetical protein MPTK1_7g19260 [Marchantia polymorpha subsp. ruderalis]|uniref:Uncharacterized protein n=2 Tax=Marchantia polymorpha TaxID=3197 RepID=A0AAF6C1D7_MARPO|nr:hypothetical protein MARPO_0067s0052 [Marchantia polymorpha]BBN18071.1 hypothetical protein Mp_7g19260 [Marchantia polymorpha subsp. ruderalis]|eukprot:PTQ35963.1 hypothetical protein MARPO_0067s0052 [Marchantia polymorpha]
MDNTGGFVNWDELMNFNNCPEVESPPEPVLVKSSDHVQMAIPMKVANELPCLKPQIKVLGNTVTFSLHFTYRVLNLIVEYISHRHQLEEGAHVDLEYEAKWERNFIQNLVSRDHRLLAEFLVAAENLREESLKAEEDDSTMLIKMADLIYLHGPSETIVDIIDASRPFSTLCRVQTVFAMLAARFSV